MTGRLARPRTVLLKRCFGSPAASEATRDTARADSMGSVYWAGLKGGDSYSMTESSGTGLTVNNESGLEQVQWGWGD